MTTVDIPAPTSGPSARLQLSDPATMLGIVATLGAVALKAVPALAHWQIDQLYPSVALIGVFIYDTVVVGKKHDLAGTLATIATPLETVAAQVATVAGVDPQIVAELRTELDTLKASVPGIAKGAVADLFTGLASAAPSVTTSPQVPTTPVSFGSGNTIVPPITFSGTLPPGVTITPPPADPPAPPAP